MELRERGILAQVIKNQEIAESLLNSNTLLLQGLFDSGGMVVNPEVSTPLNRAIRRRGPNKKIKIEDKVVPSKRTLDKQIPHNDIETAETEDTDTSTELELGAAEARPIIMQLASVVDKIDYASVRTELRRKGFKQKYLDGAMYHVIKDLVRRGQLLKRTDGFVISRSAAAS